LFDVKHITSCINTSKNYAGKCYLVDYGYPNRNGFLAPYKRQKYHISEWEHHQPVGSK
jgi:hypothetical protein